MQGTSLFPDVEQLLIRWLQTAAELSRVRFCTILPAEITETTVRIYRTAGAARNIRVDRPIVDADVYALDVADSVLIARQIENLLLTQLMGLQTPDGTVQSVSSVIGPRYLADENQDLIRYSASYEVHTHA